MKRFFSTTTGRLLLGCLVVIIVVGISIAAVELKKTKSGTNETTEVVLQENSETSVPMSDLPKEETPDAMSEAETSESEEAELSREENNTSNILGASVTTQESAKPTEPVITPTETAKPTETTKPSESVKPTESTKPTESEALTETDLYYQNNSTLINTIKIDEASDVITETEAAALFAELGFTQNPVSYMYNIDGSYDGINEISNDASKKHPIYQTGYKTANSGYWTIYIVNGMVMGRPVTYILENNVDPELIVSESEEVICYGCETNKFYINIPNKSVAFVKVIDKIDADTLNSLTYEELDDYEK